MSLCLNLSAWGSEDAGSNYALKMANARDLLSELGFVGFDHNFMDFSHNGIAGKPTKDSIGAVAANKSVKVKGKNYTLIALAIRGGGYESEWASNFTLGIGMQHEGFSDARDQVLAFLQSYISENGISGDIKLWLTGYSRAAAAANLLAGQIDEGGVSFPGCTLALPDLYAYTFETPAGASERDNVSDPAFDNIFNIINLSDPVTKVAPKAWLFARYGVDKRIPSAETESIEGYSAKVSRMLARYSEMADVSPYAVDDFFMKRLDFDLSGILPGDEPFVSIVDDPDNNKPQGEFLNDYINILAHDIIESRPTYEAYYQDHIRYMSGLFLGAGKPQQDKLIKATMKNFSDNWKTIAVAVLIAHLSDPITGSARAAFDCVNFYLEKSLAEAGITGYTSEEFKSAVFVLTNLCVILIASHPNLATTLICNISGIQQAHHPELCLAWMQSMDSHYTPGGAVGFTSGKYRIVRINCPVDIEVYNDAGELVASIIGGSPQEVSSIIASINEDGEKLVYLPASADYTVKITATGDGLMTYSVNEYNPQAGEINRLVNYYDVPITDGLELTGAVPGYSAAELADEGEGVSASVYTLAAGGEGLIPDDDLSGESATSAYFSVEAAPNDRTLGLAFGSGTRQLGRFAQVEAVPYKGSEFLGWHDGDGELVSDELKYRFRVDDDTALTAMFEGPAATDEEPAAPAEPEADEGPAIPAEPETGKEPTVPMPPEAGEEPVAPKSPAIGNNPVAAREPISAKDSVTANNPVAAKEPALAKSPVKANGPVNGNNPVAAKEPISAKDPANTEEPVINQEPLSAKAPVVTNDPAAVSYPDPGILPSPIQPGNLPFLPGVDDVVKLTKSAISPKAVKIKFSANGGNLWVKKNGRKMNVKAVAK
jgi:hypothetical protein